MAAKKPKNLVKPEHSELFDLYIQKWAEKLNLKHWRIVRDTKPSKYMAEVLGPNSTHRLAHYRLGADFGLTEVTPQSLESTAIHELLHVFLHDLLETAYAEKDCTDKLMAQEHAVIVVLESLLLRLATLEYRFDDFN